MQPLQPRPVVPGRVYAQVPNRSAPYQFSGAGAASVAPAVVAVKRCDSPVRPVTFSGVFDGQSYTCSAELQAILNQHKAVY